jgi:hypothetical protein
VVNAVSYVVFAVSRVVVGTLFVVIALPCVVLAHAEARHRPSSGMKQIVGGHVQPAARTNGRRRLHTI